MHTAKMTPLVGLLAQLLLLGPSSAADYPSRPIKLLVGASAGGTTDTMARTIAEPLSSLFGQPVLVEEPAWRRRQHRCRGGRPIGA